MEHKVELHGALLKARTQGWDEGLPEQAEDIERQMHLAYPSTTAQPMIDLLTKDHFTDALPNGDTRLYVWRNRPASSKNVLHLALELESCDVAPRSHQNVKGAQLEEDTVEVWKKVTKATDPAMQQVLEIQRAADRPSGRESPLEQKCLRMLGVPQEGAQKETVPKTAAAIPQTKF